MRRAASGPTTKSRALPDGVVLVDDAAVLDGHRPSRERHDAAALRLVQVEQRRLAQGRRGVGHRRLQCNDGSMLSEGIL
jgi:hypothetical protein